MWLLFHVQEPQRPPTIPALSARSLGPLSPSTQHTLVLPPPSQAAGPAQSQEQPEASGQRPDLAASTQVSVCLYDMEYWFMLGSHLTV